MLNKVIAYIEQNQLVVRKDKVVIGISGGADSVCLFFVFLELRKKYDLELFAVHIHHGIRGIEADEDEQFVRELVKKENVSYFPIWKDVKKLAKELGTTEEETGRMVRYEAFYEILRQVNGTKIAVAHNQNDCAETVLFQLFRGSGLKGMGGISPKRDEIIRPLLAVGRKEIEQYLKELGQLYRIDRTNLEQEYTRNKIRLSILPMVEQEVNEKAIEHITKTAQFMRELEQYIRKNVEFAFEKIVSKKNGQYFMELSLFELEDIVIKRELIKYILIQVAKVAKDIEAKHIEKILNLTKCQTGKGINLPYQIVVKKQYEFLVFSTDKREEKKEKQDFYYELIPNKTYKIEEKGLEITLKLEKMQLKCQEIQQTTCVKWLDYDKIEKGMCIRGRRPGDYLQINKEGGNRKLKDYFIDKKIPREKRKTMPLLADGSHIIWILFDRISERYKVTDTTKNVLKVSIMEVKKDGR